MSKIPESTTIALPRNMSLVKRITEVSRRITEWLDSLDHPFNMESDKLQLIKCERSDKEYSYKYSVINRKELSASDVNKLV